MLRLYFSLYWVSSLTWVLEGLHQSNLRWDLPCRSRIPNSPAFCLNLTALASHGDHCQHTPLALSLILDHPCHALSPVDGLLSNLLPHNNQARPLGSRPTIPSETSCNKGDPQIRDKNKIFKENILEKNAVLSLSFFFFLLFSNSD